VGVTLDDNQKAREISKNKNTHFDDALHVVLAQKAGVKILVTRNIEHFADFQDIIDIKYPEAI
jgi:predicted nucleic acid-binding protein